MLDVITRIIEQTGYLGIALLMLAENVFPPIPSELIMPLAGYLAAQGQLNVALAAFAGSVGSLAGTWFWYELARRYGQTRLERLAARHGRWLALRRTDIRAADEWLDRHGTKAVLLGRLVPTVRTLISVPAGLSGMSRRRFLVYSAVGTVLWTTFLLLADWWLGDQQRLVSQWIGPLANIVLACLVLVWAYRVVTFRREPA